MGMDLWEPDWQRFSSETELPALRIRPLGEHDQPLMEALFADSPGYSLFLRVNLSYLQSSRDLVRYWGAFRGPQLAAALMIVGRRAMLYAEPGIDQSTLAQLADVAGAHGVDFTMGQPAWVDAVLHTCGGQRYVQRQEHFLAEYAASGDSTPPIVVPPGALIRRAHLGDLDALTSLYYRTDGFESAGEDQLRRTLYSRIRTGRTWIAEAEECVVSAASTSAETDTAAMIGGVWTESRMRRRGFSTAVVSAVTRELIEEGRRPFLFYLTENVTAAHVYARVGYSPIGRWSVAYLTPVEPSK